MNNRFHLFGFLLAAPAGLALAILWLAASHKAVAAAPSLDPYATYYVAPGADCGGQTPCFATVQAALDVADAPDDVIKVAAGVYTDIHVRGGITQVVYLSKTVRLEGGYSLADWIIPNPEAHPSRLDAQRNGRVLTIVGSVSPGVAGFEITGGDAHGLPGGFGGQGGGVSVSNAEATLEHNRIFGNQAADGGGVHLDHSPAHLSYNTIFSNTATRSGGGGLYLYWSNAALAQNEILSNTTHSWGGGMMVDISDIILSGNILRANQADAQGGGLYFWYSHSTLSNNIIAANQGGLGTGIYVTGGSQLEIFHNTLADNGGLSGYGIWVNESGSLYSSVAMTNTILTGHAYGIVLSPHSTATLEATLWGNQFDWNNSGTLITGTVNVWGDPAFVAPQSGDYHLQASSAAVDAGVPTPLSSDIDAQPRPMGLATDLGADEIPLVVYLPLMRCSP